MTAGREFVAQYAKRGPRAWEAAALQLAREGGLTPRAWVDLPLTDGTNTVVLKVMSDVLAVGPVEDSVRLPLTPQTAQSILNLTGTLLPTPWLEYQIWRAAPVKLEPRGMVPNRFQDLEQFAEHSRIVDAQIAALPSPTDKAGKLISGQTKAVVVSNIYKPGKVVIFGWYLPNGKDVFDDGQKPNAPDRQPVQPKSNVHGDFFWDYSHGIRGIGTTAIVNGKPMPTVELYQHPTLSRLVSNEGPVRVPRYPSSVPVASPPEPIAGPVRYTPDPNVRTEPSVAQWELDQIADRARGRIS